MVRNLYFGGLTSFFSPKIEVRPKGKQKGKTTNSQGSERKGVDTYKLRGPSRPQEPWASRTRTSGRRKVRALSEKNPRKAEALERGRTQGRQGTGRTDDQA